MSANTQTRQELLTAVEKLGQLRPEWRFGQLVANLATAAGRMDSDAIWDLEDEQILAAAKELIEQFTGVEAEVA